MKQTVKYIILVISVLCCEKSFSQSLIYSQFHQTDTICETTSGAVKLYMFDTLGRQIVSNFRLEFEYDPEFLQITGITSSNASLNSNLKIFYPANNRCQIIDTLAVPINFFTSDPEAMTMSFDITLKGRKAGNTNIRFIDDSCYFLTPDNVNILGFYQVSPNITVKPGYIAMTLAQTAEGCSYEAKGQAVATVTDGVAPYKYRWDRGKVFQNQPNMAGELSGGELGLRVTDGNGCLHDTSMMITVLPAAKFDWEYHPNPAVKEYPIKFDVTDQSEGMNWEWKIYYTNPETNLRDSINLGDKKNRTQFEYVFLYEGNYDVRLSANSRITGCDTTVSKTVDVQAANLEFKNVVTPGTNRFKVIVNENKDLLLSDTYKEHKMIIVDRQGRQVFSTKSFPAEGWDGGGCPNGTYYFSLKAQSEVKEYVFRGTVVILGGY